MPLRLALRKTPNSFVQKRFFLAPGLCDHFFSSSGKEPGSAAVDSFNLLLRPLWSPESPGKLVSVKVDAVAGFDRAQRLAGGAADATVGHNAGGGRLVWRGVTLALAVTVLASQRTMLLCLGAVGLETVGEGVSGRGRVRVRCVVN